MNKKVILIASIDNHAVYYAVLANYFHEFAWRVSFVGSKDLLRAVQGLVNAQDHEYIATDEGTSVAQTTANLRELIDEHAAIFFDEGYGHPAEFYRAVQGLNPEVVKIQTVHNVNSQLRPRFYFNWDNFRNNIFRKRSVLAMDALLVCSPVLKEYIQTQTDYRKDVYCLPFIRPAVERTLVQHNEDIVFAVPGGIHSKRRNYGNVLDVFEDLWEDGTGVRLKFIGQASTDSEDQQIIQRCRTLQERYGDQRIAFYDRRLSDAEFNHEMQTTDVILSNQELEYHLSGTKEVYGQTKESGITYHMLNYAKPALVPQKLILMPRLDKQVFKYGTNGGLKRAVREMTQNTQRLQECSQHAKHNADYFRTYFDAEFESMLQKIDHQLEGGYS